MPDRDDARVHYAPGDHPLCGTESMAAVYTDDPALVAGCPDCLELAAEDLVEDNEHWAHCLHCQQEISARNGVEWRRVVRQPWLSWGLTLTWEKVWQADGRAVDDRRRSHQYDRRVSYD